jgi:hypothetical protein
MRKITNMKKHQIEQIEVAYKMLCEELGANPKSNDVAGIMLAAKNTVVWLKIKNDEIGNTMELMQHYTNCSHGKAECNRQQVDIDASVVIYELRERLTKVEADNKLLMGTYKLLEAKHEDLMKQMGIKGVK